jgi:hypothetical protein
MALLSRKALTNLRLCYFITWQAERIDFKRPAAIHCNLLAVSKVGPLKSLFTPTTEMLLLISQGFSQGIALLSARFTFIGHRWNASTILWPTDRLILSERDATAHAFIFFFKEPRIFFHIDKSMKEAF